MGTNIKPSILHYQNRGVSSTGKKNADMGKRGQEGDYE
jgi:hypothetical protein